MERIGHNSGEQNEYSKQDHSQIAEIYLKMLSGDKSALSSLQSIKLKSNSHNNSSLLKQQSKISSETPRNKLQNISVNSFEASESIRTPESSQSQLQKGNKSPKETSLKNKNHGFLQESVPKGNQDRRNQINNQEVEESNRQAESLQKNLKRNDNHFRNYIKRKVSELRNEKQLIKSRHVKQLGDIGKSVKINMLTQSKSFDMVKNHQKVPKPSHPNTQQPNTKQITANQKQAKPTTNKQVAQPQAKNKAINTKTKNFPPIHKKVLTEEDLGSHHQQTQHGKLKISRRKQVNTPIDLANSKISAQKKQPPSTVNSRKTEIPKVVPIKRQSKKISPQKVSLPQLKRQREQFAQINDEEKNAQFQLTQYHLMNKAKLEKIQNKYSLNYRQETYLESINQMNLGLNLETHQHVLGTQGSKSFSKVNEIQQKISSNQRDVINIDQLIRERQQKLRNVEKRLNKNLFHLYWIEHDIDGGGQDQYEEEFQEAVDDLPPPSQHESKSSGGFQLKSAYSTVMSEARDKKWSLNKRKQYDTNRSFQQFSKSRSRTHQKSRFRNNLTKIEERVSQEQQPEQQDMEESESNNKIVVNSRLRNLLF